VSINCPRKKLLPVFWRETMCFEFHGPVVELTSPSNLEHISVEIGQGCTLQERLSLRSELLFVWRLGNSVWYCSNAHAADSVKLSQLYMAPKKGLSFDEKRDRLLELFTESVCYLLDTAIMKFHALTRTTTNALSELPWSRTVVNVNS
jgi:hypothetical protein